MRKYLLIVLVFISAFAVSTSAAFYSITGLSKLFAGATVAVIIMASSLEFSKIVIATILHRYWKVLHWMIRYYLVTAVIVLVIITSAGIYGFLSNAYQITSTKDNIIQTEISILKSKQDRFIEQRDILLSEKTEITNSITELRKNISAENKRQHIDKKSGEIITNVYTNTKSQELINKQLDVAVSNQERVDSKINSISDSIATLDMSILDIESKSDVAAELGPLKYLARITGKEMDIIVNWFLLLLIFVFDPLAIVLVITANFLLGKINRPAKIDVEPVLRPYTSVSPPEGYTYTPPDLPIVKTEETEATQNDEKNDIERDIRQTIPWAFTKDTNFRNTPHQDR